MSRITEFTEIYVNIHGSLASCSRDDVEEDIDELLAGRGYVSGGGSMLDGSGSNIDILLQTQESQAVDRFVAKLLELLRRIDLPRASNVRVITDASDRRLPIYGAGDG